MFKTTLKYVIIKTITFDNQIKKIKNNKGFKK